MIWRCYSQCSSRRSPKRERVYIVPLVFFLFVCLFVCLFCFVKLHIIYSIPNNLLHIHRSMVLTTTALMQNLKHQKVSERVRQITNYSMQDILGKHRLLTYPCTHLMCCTKCICLSCYFPVGRVNFEGDRSCGRSYENLLAYMEDSLGKLQTTYLLMFPSQHGKGSLCACLVIFLLADNFCG